MTTEERSVEKVIFIDDEIGILNSIKRVFRKSEFEVIVTENPEDVFQHIQDTPVALVVSDQRMPKMEGVQVLEKVKELSPNTVRMMLTGYADIQAATHAINKGGIFRFLTKPWDESDLRQAIQHGIDQYRLITENIRLQALTKNQNAELKDLNENLEKKVYERTEQITKLNRELKVSFMGSIKMMDKLAQVHNPTIGSHAKRVTKLLIPLAKKMGMDSNELFEVQVAALLHDIGKIGVPSGILEKDLEKLNPEEKNELRKHVIQGEILASEIPNLGNAPKIIRHHHEYYNGKGYPDQLSGDQIPLGSRLIAVVDAYDKILNMGEQFGSENSDRALEFLTENAGIFFDPEIVDALKEYLNKTNDGEMEVGINELLPGMQLSRNVKSSEGKNLAGKDWVLKDSTIEKIQAWLRNDPHINSVYVYRMNRGGGVSESEEKVAGWG